MIMMVNTFTQSVTLILYNSKDTQLDFLLRTNTIWLSAAGILYNQTA